MTKSLWEKQKPYCELYVSVSVYVSVYVDVYVCKMNRTQTHSLCDSDR